MDLRDASDQQLLLGWLVARLQFSWVLTLTGAKRGNNHLKVRGLTHCPKSPCWNSSPTQLISSQPPGTMVFVFIWFVFSISDKFEL